MIVGLKKKKKKYYLSNTCKRLLLVDIKKIGTEI
jgi:hypothetical protein